MMTREEILSIEEYCAEHKVSHKERLAELCIPYWKFYRAKRKYRMTDESQSDQPGEFIQLSSGRYVSCSMPPARTVGRSGKFMNSQGTPLSESNLAVELQSRNGVVIRVQGNMSPAHLRELINAV